MKNKTFQFATFLSLMLCTINVFATDYTLSTAANIANQCYAVGDTVTISDNSVDAVMGEKIATLKEQTITMVGPGGLLLKDTSGTEHIFFVYEKPANNGEVFFCELVNNNVSWDTFAWTKVYGSSDRTYPNAPDDVAIIVNRTSNYRYINVRGDGVTIGQLVVCLDNPFTINQSGGATRYFKFSRTDSKAPIIYLSTTKITNENNNTTQFRMGEHDHEDGGNVLALSFDGPEMIIDWTGDTMAVGPYFRTRAIQFALGRTSITINEGQTLKLQNGSYVSQRTYDDFYIRGRLGSGVFGEGTVEIKDVCLNTREASHLFEPGKLCVNSGFDSNGVNNNVSRFSTSFTTIPDFDIEFLSGTCPTNHNYYNHLRSLWKTGTPNAVLSKSIFLSGTAWWLDINGDYAPTVEYLQSTNTAEKVTVRGHVKFYTAPAYNPDGGHVTEDGQQRGRVTTNLRFKNLLLDDKWTTLSINGFNFCRNTASTNEIRGTVKIDNWADYIVRPEGVNPENYNEKEYAIIPWLTVHANDNNQDIFDLDWGGEHTFPAIRESDGLVQLYVSLNNRGDATLSKRGENDNFYFADKGGFHLNGADRRIFSLVYSIGETVAYAAGGNFYLDTSKGGHKLYITSGAMAVTRNGKWLGQPIDMTRNGKIVLEGNPSYLHSTSGHSTIVSNNGGSDFNMVWIPLVAENDLVIGNNGAIGIAGDQRGIKGTMVLNGGRLFLGYPSYEKTGYLYSVGNPEKGWPMHGVATDCDFRIRGGAVLCVASSGYTGVDSDGNEIDEPVFANSASAKRKIILERSGLTVGSVFIAENLQPVINELYVQNDAGEEITLERGIWGSSESDAELVDDSLFAGPGTIKVLHDLLVRPTAIIIR